jgi:hypothetical protein
MDIASIIIIVAVLLAMALVGVRQSMRHSLKDLKQLKAELREHFEARRELVAYLIEAYKAVVEHPSDQITPIVKKRREARESQSFNTLWQHEQELEQLIEAFLKELKSNQALKTDMAWLEASAELKKSWEATNDKEKIYHDMEKAVMGKAHRFPFSMFA